jgi:hypothetical protein
MKLPNAENAVIAAEKLKDYLLNPLHKKGGPKARLLLSLGYSGDDWQRLEADLRNDHLGAEVVGESENEYGKCYDIVDSLHSPSGRAIPFRSVWQIDTGTDYPRLITMYPE